MKLVQLNILLRQWMRGGVSTVVSLVSLTLGLICSTILLLFAVEEFRAADALTPDPADKYMLLIPSSIEKGVYNEDVGSDLVENLIGQYSQIRDYATFKQCQGKWKGKESIKERVSKWQTISTTPSFTKYFKIPMIEGNLDSVLAAPDRIAITREYAAQLFPDEDPMGQTMSVTYGDTLTVNYTVAGIINNAQRSILNVDAIYRSPDKDPSIQVINGQRTMTVGSQHTVITLAHGTNPETFCQKMAHDSLYLGFEPGALMKLTPINDIYLQERSAGRSQLLNSQNKTSLYIGLTLALVIMVIAAFNYINITLTRSASRLKNLAGQRIMGASKWNVRGQIFADTAINVGLALLLALVFLPLCMEGFNSFMDSRISMGALIHPINLLWILGLLAVLIVIPSISLIIKFSIRNPLETFKSPEGRKLRAAQPLVIAQIVVSVALLSFGINVARQQDHVAHSMPSSDNILVISSSDNNLFKPDFVDKLRTSASTKGFITGVVTPNSSTKTTIDNGTTTSIFTYSGTNTHPSIFDVLNVKLIEGRTFDQKSNDQYLGIVVNQAMVKYMGIKGSAVGQIVDNQYRIVGVCPDFRVMDARAEVTPTVYMYSVRLEKFPHIIHLGFSGSIDDKIAEVQTLFKKNSDKGSLPPNILTLSEKFIKSNPDIERMKTMIDVFTTISFLLTAFGLFGLSWYMVERRRREIAIRKTYGATVARIVAMLCRSFLWQSLIAIVIALPAAYFISGYWLEGFVYRVDNAWWVLAVTSAVSLVVIFATVIGQTIRAALTNPVKYIKTE